MDNENVYTIRSVVQLTGLKPHVIRTWERRYGAIEPHRTPTNRRMYARSDIEKLRLLKQAVGQGHSISRIAKMNAGQLSELLETPLSSGKTPVEIESAEMDDKSPENFLQRALTATAQLDQSMLQEVLTGAVVDLSRSEFVHRFVVPLCSTIGDRWAAGRLRIPCEHMATAMVRSFLWDLLRGVELDEHAPKILLATPVGQWHELGLLVAALEAAESGWRPVYAGASLPAEEIAYAVERTGAKALALHIAHSIDDGRLPMELEKLHRYLNGNVTLFVGGRGCEALERVLGDIKAIRISDIHLLREQLQRLNEHSSGR